MKASRRWKSVRYSAFALYGHVSVVGSFGHHITGWFLIVVYVGLELIRQETFGLVLFLSDGRGKA